MADISMRHAIPLTDVTALRGKRPWLVDSWVLTCVAAAALIGAGRLTQAFAERFSGEPRWFYAVAALASVGFAVVATAALMMLAYLVEIARLWDGHMGYRGGRLPWEQHPVLVFFGAWLFFWVMVVSRDISRRWRNIQDGL